MNYFKSIIPKKDDVIEYQVNFIDKEPKIATVRKLIVYTNMFKAINYLVEIDELAPKSIGGYETINVDHIKRIIKHSKYVPKKINIYYKHNVHQKCWKEDYFSQHLFNILKNEQNCFINRQVNIERAEDLYSKNGFGLKQTKHGLYKINKRKFKKWVSMNISRIQNTVSEQREIRSTGKIEEKQFYEDEMESMMKWEDEHMEW